mmetsp:Transcript_44147/g.81606  ORF Transcript_44147/g.81606 Transcript_44147/m.81606 type:complete len:356 (+) Transcript_44147:1299-2366(+)
MVVQPRKSGHLLFFAAGPQAQLKLLTTQAELSLGERVEPQVVGDLVERGDERAKHFRVAVVGARQKLHEGHFHVAQPAGGEEPFLPQGPHGPLQVAQHVCLQRVPKLHHHQSQRQGELQACRRLSRPQRSFQRHGLRRCRRLDGTTGNSSLVHSKSTLGSSSTGGSSSSNSPFAVCVSTKSSGSRAVVVVDAAAAGAAVIATRCVCNQVMFRLDDVGDQGDGGGKEALRGQTGRVQAPHVAELVERSQKLGRLQVVGRKLEGKCLGRVGAVDGRDHSLLAHQIVGGAVRVQVVHAASLGVQPTAQRPPKHALTLRRQVQHQVDPRSAQPPPRVVGPLRARFAEHAFVVPTGGLHA